MGGGPSANPTPAPIVRSAASDHVGPGDLVRPPSPHHRTRSRFRSRQGKPRTSETGSYRGTPRARRRDPSRARALENAGKRRRQRSTPRDDGAVPAPLHSNVRAKEPTMFILGEIIGWEFLLVLALIALLFGSSKLPKLARSMGQAKSELEKGM